MSNSQNTETDQVVLFSLEEPRYALYLSAVNRVIQSVEITPLPKAPAIVLGVINVQGEVIPVIDIRRLFRLPLREIGLQDQFIIARTSKRHLVIVADSVNGITDVSKFKIANTNESLNFTHYLSGVTVFENKIVLINDPENFLSLEDEDALEKALKEAAE